MKKTSLLSLILAFLLFFVVEYIQFFQEGIPSIILLTCIVLLLINGSISRFGEGKVELTVLYLIRELMILGLLIALIIKMFFITTAGLL